MTTPQPTKPNPKQWWLALGAAAFVGIGAFVVTRDNGGLSGAGSGRNGTSGAKIGTTVRDGGFEFVVRSVQCGVGQIGPDSANERAQGQFCLVSLTVKNVGDRPQRMRDTAQKAMGTNHARYATSLTAGLYANEPDNQVWQTEINPGNEVTGTLVYDLPKDVDLAQLELHESATSTGVKVTLR